MVEDGEDGGKSHSNSMSIPASSSSKDEIRTVAEKIAAQSAQIPRPGVWGVLTAISDKARKRSQGMHILMHGNEHVLGRTVKETSCQFDSPNVSGRHCRVYRKKVVLENTEQSTGTCYFVFLKDSSSNGTYLNWEKLKKDSPETQVRHGDIISLVNPPEHENAFAFVYREIRQELSSSHQQNSVSNTTAKRKAPISDTCGEEFVGDSKRIKGLGIGGPEGPVSLDDVRRLQRSNEDLRQKLEAHVLTIEKLHSEARATAAHHDNELKELRESISVSFQEEIKQIRYELATKEKELEEAMAVSTQQQSCIEDLNQQLAAAAQSRRDAEEIIQSQKAAIAEHEKQLEEERNQRRDEREKGEADLKAAVERVRAESLEELKRQSEAAARQQKEQLDVINKLQESDKENRMFMESLRSKLEDVRESLMKAEKRGRQLEVQLHEEELASAAARKKAAEKDHELQRSKRQVENEKAAREDAWAKVSSLELEIASAVRDLALERQRLQGARERIVLRETQLRAFHSTAEEIAVLQRKQQEQLNGMLRTLEDGENREVTNTNNDFELRTENLCREVTRAREEIMAVNTETDRVQGEGVASDQAETPKKLGATNCASDSGGGENCNMNKFKTGDAVDDWENGDTQEEDCENTLQMIHDTEAIGTMLNHDDEHIGTERVLATEADATQLLESTSGCRRIEFCTYPMGNEPAKSNKNLRETVQEDDEVGDGEGGLGGETMQLEDEEQAPMEWARTDLAGENQGETLNTRTGAEPKRLPDTYNSGQHLVRTSHPIGNSLNGERQSQSPVSQQHRDEIDARNKGDKHSIATIDLLASEVAGSWAVSTVGSVQCDNESLRSDDRQPGTGRISDEGINQDFDASQIAVAGENIRSRQDLLLSSLKCQDTVPEDAVAGSQNSPPPKLASRKSYEHQALNEMLDIVAPDFRQLHGLRRNNDNAPDTEEDTEGEEDDKNHDDDDTEEGSEEPESE